MLDFNKMSGADIDRIIAELSSHTARFDELPTDAQKQLYQALSRLEAYKRHNQRKWFKPDDWQNKAFDLGKTELHRGVIAGNRLGKSYMAAYEISLHLTGRYPDDWKGRRFEKPGINAVALGFDFAQISRPGAMQSLICGPATDRGAGFIHKDEIVEIITRTRGVIGTIYVQHYDSFGNKDGLSRLDFGAYSQGDECLMGASYDFGLIDECPRDDSIFEQMKKRTWDVEGSTLCVFTPEKGLNKTVEAFWNDDGLHHSGLIHVTLWDSTLISEEEKHRRNNECAPWARGYSIMGIPSAGTGAVFSGIVKETIVIPYLEIPDHWPRISAIDFGMRDTNVVTFWALDPETDTYYLYDEMSHNDTDAIMIAPTLKMKQQGFIPCVYPPDANTDRGTGDTYAEIYKRHGCDMSIPAHNYALDPDGTNRNITPGIHFLRELMLTGRFKVVAQNCPTFMKEFDLYSYDKSGKFIDKNNHAIDSARYGTQALKRFGVSKRAHAITDSSYIDWSAVEGSSYL